MSRSAVREFSLAGTSKGTAHGWPQAYSVVRDRVVAALGIRLLAIEHVGSTAVPGLWAKPVIDIDLTVADSADEDAWLPDLEAVGFVLRVREPDWEEHRVLRGQDPATNLHVFSSDAREPHRVRMFRDWLRTHPEDRDRPPRRSHDGEVSRCVGLADGDAVLTGDPAAQPNVHKNGTGPVADLNGDAESTFRPRTIGPCGRRRSLPTVDCIRVSTPLHTEGSHRHDR